MKKENEVKETPAQVEVQVKVRGRKINASSKRQQVLAKREAAKASGTFKKGRPTVASSKRQQVLASRMEKIASGISVKRGRPKKSQVTA